MTTQDFIKKYDWDLEMKEVAQWNAESRTFSRTS
ncbi:hypothetical protein HRED_10482 [Candidatus Haloredivivus sp. G17]|nr:hypothetical protein HRED_10482 [Candidatus Haloredivivus sp. G17]